MEQDLFSSYDDSRSNKYDVTQILTGAAMSYKEIRKNTIIKLQSRIKILDVINLIAIICCFVLSFAAIESSLVFVRYDTLKENENSTSSNCFDFDYKGNFTLEACPNLDDYSTVGCFIPCFDDNFSKAYYFKIIISFLTIFSIFLLILRSNFLLAFNKSRLYIKQHETLRTTGYLNYLIFEILLNLIHPLPIKNMYFKFEQRNADNPAYVEVGVILTILLMFFRSYHIFRFFSFHSRWFSYETEKICFECQTPLDYIFAFKAEFKEKPFTLVGLTMLMSIFIFGYSLRCIEMFFMSTTGLDWRYYWNGMWCVIITMATVGFGDFYPTSIIGRLIVIISCFWGTFLISLMVAAMSLAVEFNSQEAIAFESIKAAYFEIEYGEQATILIQNAARYKSLLKKSKSSTEFSKLKSKAFQQFKNSLEKFRKLKKSKNDILEAMLIEMSINKIEENLTIELDKIKSNLKVVFEIKELLEEYTSNQEKIKEKNLAIYKDLQDICFIKAKFCS